MRFKTTHFGASVLVFTTAALLMAATAGAQRPKPPAADKTIVVMLGTGTPGWDPDRSGPATAIVVNETPYLVDFGPGVVMPRVHQIDLTNFCGLLGELT